MQISALMVIALVSLSFRRATGDSAHGGCCVRCGCWDVTVHHNHCSHGPHTDSVCVCLQSNSVEGVSVAAFYLWRKKLRGGKRGRRSKGSAATAEGASGSIGPLSRESFLPVRVAERSVATAGVPAPPVNNPRRTTHGDTVPATPARIEVRLTNGVCIFVPCTEPNAFDGVISAVG